MTNHIHPDYRKVMYVWLLACLAALAQLCSCSPGKKAHEYFASHPKEFAQDCSDAYPIVPIIDSSAFKESLKAINDLQENLKADKFKDDQDRQWNESEISRLKAIAPKDCDSLSKAYTRQVNKEKSRADTLEKRVNQLTDAARNVKPVQTSFENTAKIEACEQDRSRLTTALTNAVIKNSELTAQVDTWKGKAHKYFWIIVAILAVNAIIKFRKPIINLIKSFV
jgi:flagellar biosynthesis GTPase FlhF